MIKTAYKREYPYIYRGIVEGNEDPEHLGRCRVRVPFIHGDLTYPVDALPWSRPIVTTPVKSGRGSVNIPDVGDVVWVFFEGADRDYPVHIGGTYARGEIDANPDKVDFYIEDDNKISYDRKEMTYTILIGETEIKVTRDGIYMTGDTFIKGDVQIDGDLTVNGNIKVSGNLNVSGTTTLTNLIITGSCNKECTCA